MRVDRSGRSSLAGPSPESAIGTSSSGSSRRIARSLPCSSKPCAPVAKAPARWRTPRPPSPSRWRRIARGGRGGRSASRRYDWRECPPTVENQLKRSRGGSMSDKLFEEFREEEEEAQLTRRRLFVTGGLAAAGLTALGSPAGRAFAAADASTIKVAVVTHGDTGSFWSVFKRGVDQAAKDLKGRGVSVTQVYANNDVAKQVAGLNAAIASGAKVIATSVPDASALKDPLSKASKKGIVIITVNSGLGAFDDLRTYEVHVGQTEDVAGEGAGKQFKKAGAKKVLVVPHEASNSGLTQRAAGVKKILGGGGVKVLTIPNAKSDIPGTKTKVQAAFKADKSLNAFLGLDPDVSIPMLDVLPKGTKAGTFD